ncbi:MAG: glycosyltransferase family 4 protein [Sedimentisphaerales bacterium]|nr:glycosyltransferase family 4 protein [Sedimentisphaerales bacterium]
MKEIQADMKEIKADKRIAVLSPVAWRTPPRAYGAWETVASNIAEGLTARGWDVTLFATADSVTTGKLHAVIEQGYEEDKSLDPKVAEILHISEVMERAGEFDLIHNNYDFIPLAFSRLINTPMLTTIHGFSSDKIRAVYRKYKKDSYFVSISDSDRDPELPYLATVYNGIDLTNLTFREKRGDKLVFLGRIHPDKGVHLAIETAQRCGKELIIAGIIQDQEYFDTQVGPHIDERQIHYIGPVDPPQRDALLAKAFAALHLNTIPERFGLVMAEAMAAGVPVIAMDLGSCREVIEDGVTGFLVKDVREAIEAVGRIETLSRADCRRRVEENFTIDYMVSGYEKVYQEIFRREAARNRK